MATRKKKAVTIIEIAKECKVSPSTVSLVLNNSPKIKQATKDRVLAAAQKLNYEPNEFARGLVSRRSRTLSVTVPALDHVFSDVYFGEIISGIYDEAYENGYKILLDIAQESFIGNKEYLTVLRNRRADGMLYIASTTEDRFLLEFENEPYPLVLVNHYFPDSTLNFLSVDYETCAVLAANHLLELGHRHIGLIAGTNTFTGLDFRDRFLEQCQTHGIPEAQLPWTDAEWDEHGGYEAARKLIARYPEITAIMAANDRMAIGAMRYLLAEGVDVPTQVSVMGMDNIPSARYSNPGLSTIRMNFYEVGRQSCRRLLGLLDGSITSCREKLEPTLVVRESTRKAP